MGGPEHDPTKAWADQLGDLNQLSLDDLGGDDEVSTPDPMELDTENSFADARLDALPGEPLTGGDASSGAGGHGAKGSPAMAPPGGGQRRPPPTSRPLRQPSEPPAVAEPVGVGLDLSLVEDGAIVVSKADLARGKKEDPRKENTPALEKRGATGIAAPTSTGPIPVGHKERSRGLFAYDPVNNAMTAAVLALMLSLLPAWLVSSSTASSDEVSAAFASMEAQHQKIGDLGDPNRNVEGPQSTDAVAADLTAAGRQIDEDAATVEAAIGSARGRFWGVWLGLGLPLAGALSFLRRKG